MTFLRKTTLSAALVAASLFVNAQTPIEKANKQYELHAYRLAAKSFETILQRDPEELSVAARLADAYFHLNELENAIRNYSKASLDSKVAPQVALNYGKTLMMLGRYDEAEVQFKNYQKTDNSTAENYLKSCQFARNASENRSEFTVAPLSKANSNGSDMSPAFFGDQLIWSSSRTDLKRAAANKENWSGAAENQMFISPIENVSNQAFKVGFYKNDLKNNFNESNPSFSADGKTVAFMRNNFDEGERISSDGGMEFTLFLANVDAEGNWTDVHPFAYNGFGYSTGFPALSPDGKTLYFASNRPGGQGGYDIYMCAKRGNIWGEPRNAGAAVNTKGDEITPFSDGKTLYFASDFHAGFGGFDIFKTENGSSDVRNVGNGINTSGDDFGFVFDPSVKTGFFVSNRKGGKGKEDIYRVEKQSESANLVIVESGVLRSIKDAKVTVTQGDPKNLSQLKGGNWMLDLDDNKTYTIEVKKEGFKAKSMKIEPNYSKTTRTIEVILEKDVPTSMNVMPDYVGNVLDGSTNKPLENVLVKATNQASEIALEATTDKEGKYKFPFTPASSYLITYSKEGFTVGKKSVRGNEIKNRNLGDFTMKPSAVSDKSEILASVETKPKTMDNKPSDIPAEYSVVTSKNISVPLYAVQLAVSASDDVLNLSKYDALKSSGNLYIVPESGKQKVRLGTFKTKEEANETLKKASKLGISGAYVIAEKNAKVAGNNVFEAKITPKALPKPISVDTAKKAAVKALPKPIAVDTAKKTSVKPLPKPIKGTKATPKVTSKSPQPKANPVPKSYSTVVKPATEVVPVVATKAVVVDKTFKIKIAAMKKPEWFDDSKVAAIWKVEQVKEGALTIFIMDGIKTLEQAKDLKSKVKAAGYKDAKVVVKEGDKFKVVD